MRMATETHKAHLGVGWAFPVKPVDGRVRFAFYEDDVEQAIQIILLTSRNERVMLPEFGAGLRDFVFEPNSESVRARIAETVRNALVDWEPRINLERVEVTAGDENNVVLIHIDYVVRATNQFYNRVFPFYLLEGRA
jgi:phage baseplate assembly protein W